MADELLLFGALLPLLVVFIGLAGLRISGRYVGPLGWIMASVLAFILWSANLPDFILISVSAVVWTLIIFVWNIIGAFFFLNFLRLSSLLEVMKTAFTSENKDNISQILLVGFSLALFLGAVGPGGSNFAITSLLLTSWGIPPIQAAVVGLFGNGLQSPYGLLGTSTYALARVTGIDISLLSPTISSLMILFVLVSPLWMIYLLKHKMTRDVVFHALSIGVVYALLNWGTASFLGPELPNLLAGGGSLLVGFLLMIKKKEASLHQIHRWALIPFMIITLLLLMTRLFLPLKTLLPSSLFTIVLDFTITDPIRFSYLYSPGTIMIITTLLCAYFYHARLKLVGNAISQTLRQALPILISISSFVAMAEIMRFFGMITVLAETMAIAAGNYYPFIAPAIGALGCAITGSTTSSNILFGRFHVEVADRLGLSSVIISASQSVGCMAGEVISPLNAIVITTPLGIKGQEGESIRRNFSSSILYLVLAASLTYFLISVS
jgi:lactate permease